MLQASTAQLHSPLLVFMNISAATLDIRTFFSLFQSKLMALDPEVRNRLVIEIPESSDMRGAELVRRLRAIKSTGAKVAIDDFGQEHANQERLEAFDWDFCKIDLPAIQTTENLNWVDAAIRHCYANKTHLIMEKVESSQDIDHLLHPVRNTAWFQGYCFSRPEVVGPTHALVGLEQSRANAGVLAWG